MFCQTIQLNYYMADKSKENNKLLFCTSLKNLIHLEPAFVWQLSWVMYVKNTLKKSQMKS